MMPEVPEMRCSPALVTLACLLALAGIAWAAPGGQARGLVHAPRAAGATVEATPNWAGYAVMSPDPSTTMSFTSITGTWKQSAATCSANEGNAASAVWVGLGGYSQTSQALEQIGTDADCSSSSTPEYYAWYELYPSLPVNLNLEIKPGDLITTSVNVTGMSVLLQIKDRTRRTVFTKRLTASVIDLSSAEWVTEAPSSCTRYCTTVPLANFGNVSFSRIATTAVLPDSSKHPGTLTDPTWETVGMQLVPDAPRGFVPGGSRRFSPQTSTAGTTAPTPPTPDGRSFSLSWLADATAS
jgi:hypothetical protein